MCAALLQQHASVRRPGACLSGAKVAVAACAAGGSLLSARLALPDAARSAVDKHLLREGKVQRSTTSTCCREGVCPYRAQLRGGCRPVLAAGVDPRGYLQGWRLSRKCEEGEGAG
ncbi:hypothetical protein NDU88_011236 [Pleurodeles waltl]|uniref:Uncharacterized protein n=1 Tax=Pleurodeles waltl TaxID=8319 RepID=A0AAV7QWM9_PLEWA|nr:hypothetical protein NDU88_011236 [Pleurodeles waltl]